MFHCLIVFSMIVLVSCMPSSRKNKCDLQKVDRCAQILYIYGNPTYKVSNSVEEAQEFCNTTRDAEQCIRSYSSSCVKPFSRQYTNILLAGPSQQLKKRCSPTGIKKYLDHKECVNATKSKIDICNDRAIRDTMRILKAKKDDWIQLSCCFLSKSTQCSSRAIDNEDICTEKSKEYMKEAIQGFSGEVFDLFCGNDLHWESHNCQKVIKNLAHLDSRTKRPLSIFPVVLEMMEKF